MRPFRLVSYIRSAGISGTFMWSFLMFLPTIAKVDQRREELLAGSL